MLSKQIVTGLALGAVLLGGALAPMAAQAHGRVFIGHSVYYGGHGFGHGFGRGHGFGHGFGHHR
ncbi:MAG: hypothetical protein ACREUV_09255 [Burkholderiales bacterium]